MSTTDKLDIEECMMTDDIFKRPLEEVLFAFFKLSSYGDDITAEQKKQLTKIHTFINKEVVISKLKGE